MSFTHFSRSSRLRLFCALALCVGLLSCGGDDDGTGPEGCTGTCLVVQNTSTLTVNVVNFSNCGDPNWGSDRLGSDEIAPNQSHEWQVAPGCYDVRGIADFGGGTCAISFFGRDIVSGEREVVVYDGC